MTTISLAHAVPRSEALRNSLVLLVFGIFLVGMTGFSHLENLHNAAHDTRPRAQLSLPLNRDA